MDLMKMKQYEIKYADRYYEDLYEILDYLNNFSKQTAQKYFKLIDKKIDTLRMAPLGVSYVRNERLRAKGFRCLYIRNYCLFFKVEEENALVKIERILYSKREFDLIL